MTIVSDLELKQKETFNKYEAQTHSCIKEKISEDLCVSHTNLGTNGPG
jgi:hypothetical protein